MPIPTNLRRYIHTTPNPPHRGGGEAEVPCMIVGFQGGSTPNPRNHPHRGGEGGLQACTIYEMRSGQNPILMLVGCCSNLNHPLWSLVCKPQSNMNRRPTHHLGNILGMSMYCTCREFFQETCLSNFFGHTCDILRARFHSPTKMGHDAFLFASTGRVVPSALQSRQWKQPLCNSVKYHLVI